MKKKIYKYSLTDKDAPELMAVGLGRPFKMKMIKGAKILSVQAQAERSGEGTHQATGKIWVLCDSIEKEMEDRLFVLIETGKGFDVSDKRYIGTYQLYEGDVVLHLFEVIRPFVN